MALVHRPRYDDWTLPKGKLHAGESELDAAVREVGEEVGAAVAVRRRLGQIRYDAEGEPKSVAYWSMRYVGGAFAPNAEVDEVRWCSPEQARRLLTYPLDRSIVEEFSSVPTVDSVVILVRHARAGKRSQWHDEDALRPLEPAGLHAAQALVPLLRHFGPTRVIAAEPVRCVQTLAPLAHALNLPVEVVPAFGDDHYVRAPIATETALFSLAKPDAVTVVCSQGTTIPALLSTLAPQVHSTETRKGEFWVLSFVDGDVAAADHYPG